MANVIEIVVPPMGEPIDSARLVSWAVLPGQAFRTDDILLEIETDKSIIEVPAQEDGLMLEHLVSVDGLLNSDTPIARVQIEGESHAKGVGKEPKLLAVKDGRDAVEPLDEPEASEIAVGRRDPSGGGLLRDRKLATPAARRLAGKFGIAIDTITGTGPCERVTQADISRALLAAGRRGAVDSAMAASGRTGLHETMVPTAYGEICIKLGEPVSIRSGPTVVLIHGIFGDRNTWTGIAHVVNRAGLRVLSMDLPCHGRSKSEITGFAEIVETVAEVIAKQCPGSIALVGHSFGGAVAAKVARKPNLGIESLVLIAPLGMGSEIEQSFLNGMTYADSNEAMLRELAKLTVAGTTPSIAYVNELRECIQARRDRMIEFCRRISWNGVQQLNALPDLVGLQRPIVVIQGRRDQIIPWQHVLNIPARVSLHLLPEAGHMPQWEATTLTTDIILDTVLR